tara:strand:+ start:3981 stop:4601 length:621 start_codon:yes stop_codon:yes gene_type:complete
MTSLNLGQKNFVIISDDSIIFNALRDNTNFPVQLFDSGSVESINNISKVDLLIIDKKTINNSNIPLYRVNHLVNLTSKKIVKSEINFQKPLKLNELLKIIYSNMQDEYLFCCINESWIYHQRLAKISSIDTEIVFTDKENSIFLELLISKNFVHSKEYLKHKIWNYHQDSQSTTVDTHLYKLKQKLPNGLIEIKATQCSLGVSSLF